MADKHSKNIEPIPEKFPGYRYPSNGGAAEFSNYYRPNWVEINHKNLENNFREMKKLLPDGVSVLAVVKANAYGHGMIPVSRTLEGCKAKFFGVTSVEEALALKSARVKTPALILGNIFPFTNLLPAIKDDVRITVASVDSAKMCDHYAKKAGKKVFAHAKIDTGMNRIGVNVRHGLEFINKIRSFKNIKLEGMYTHFSDSADDPGFTGKQLKLFKELIAALRSRNIAIPYLHCANSAAIIKYPEARLSMVRPGISLYGVNPVSGAGKVRLKPVLSWKSRIVFLKDVPAGTPVSYARTFTTKKKSRIATAAFGYADGFRRSLSNKGVALVRGRRSRAVGRITMDMTMLDVTGIPGVEVGDEVVLIGAQGGDNISVQEFGVSLDTSPYEAFCGISIRVPRINIY